MKSITELETLLTQNYEIVNKKININMLQAWKYKSCNL
jgi:hypothetical protein